jgi:hypothetical protein
VSVPFWTGNFLIIGREEGTHSLAPLFSTSPPNYFFWGFVKDTVYHEKVKYVNKLHDRIVRAAEYITSEMFINTWQETEYCVDVYCTTNGVHTEIY